MSEILLPLSGWGEFYVIVGGTAAALTGLQFVVITLAAERQSITLDSARAFASPTIVHYCAALFVSAVFGAPWHRLLWPGTAAKMIGLAGLVYTINATRLAVRQTQYKPVLEDWIWHFVVPSLSYAATMVAGFMLLRHSESALFAIAMLQIVLLFVGIHNAWDSALYIAVQKSERKHPRH
jgi:hypothetical protein